MKLYRTWGCTFQSQREGEWKAALRDCPRVEDGPSDVLEKAALRDCPGVKGGPSDVLEKVALRDCPGVEGGPSGMVSE